ncbi:DNA-binding transcriptional regulator, MarR family [Albimonas donghaensis]|uniref:DNA-binding transcriptional regulator, MarR family n=2 Tax=Albimonas donghaensis TaxID=356660 RepID=A0A1H2VK97_9RHOB|nr:DNA-binding transcriptional regulator, MarR family [Albimonas donghaensis]
MAMATKAGATRGPAEAAAGPRGAGDRQVPPEGASEAPPAHQHARRSLGEAADAYRLDAQIGHLLRRANQRHLSIFSDRIPDLTPRQFAALAKLHEDGPVSQNQLGRATAMDAATIKGVIDRLAKRDLVSTAASPDDRRRLIVSLTEAGAALFAALAEDAVAATHATLAPLDPDDRAQLLRLLVRIA